MLFPRPVGMAIRQRAAAFAGFGGLGGGRRHGENKTKEPIVDNRKLNL
jgi:hypothetical protein